MSPTSATQMASIHNNMLPNNPLTKLHELNKNITPTSFKASNAQSNSFASIVHSNNNPSVISTSAPTHSKPQVQATSPSKLGRPSNTMYQSIAPKKPPFDANTMNAMNAMANRELTGGKIRQLGAGAPSMRLNVEGAKSNGVNGSDAEQANNDYALSSLDWKDGVADLPGRYIVHKYSILKHWLADGLTYSLIYIA